MKKLTLLFLLVVASLAPCLADGEVGIIPRPLSVQMLSGDPFVFTHRTTYCVNDVHLLPVVDHFAEQLMTSQGIGFKSVKSPGKAQLVLFLDASLGMRSEGYELMVKPNQIYISASTVSGIFYGLQSLLQLLPPLVLSAERVARVPLVVSPVFVKDYPAFAYRGMHLDASRRVSSVAFIKKQLDMMALLKMNRFHWHLTDDQRWTIEIKRYPRLTEVGSVRHNDDGSLVKGFYTQEEIREVVAYAAARQITVIPEIEMPGHAVAALASYPEYSCTGGPFRVRNTWGIDPELFCAGDDATFEFLGHILDEVAALFPGDYLHIGGDECPTTRWKACSRCQARMAAEGLKSEVELHGYFIRRIEQHVKSLGKTMIGWDEILDGGATQTSVVMSWRGDKGGIKAANMGNQVIMTPNTYCYLDYYQGDLNAEPMTIFEYIPLSRAYALNPVPEQIDSAKRHLVLGAQANVWVEYMPTDARKEYMIYPRLLAIAEAVWSDASRKDFVDFASRVDRFCGVLDVFGFNYHVPLPEGPVSNHLEFTDSIMIPFSNTRDYPMYYTLDGTEPSVTSRRYEQPFVLGESAVIHIATCLPNGRFSTVRRVEVVRTALSPAYGDVTEPGVLMSHLDGYHQNSSAYQGKAFSEPVVQSYFTVVNGESYKQPWVERYEGYFEVEEDGVYLVSTNSEELWIDGELVIDLNDKVRRNLTVKSTKALAKGKHAFVMYTNNIVVDGFACTWRENTFFLQSPSSSQLVKVSMQSLSH